MEIVIASDVDLVSSKVSRIADKRLTQLIGAFPSITDIKFYLGKENDSYYYELGLKIKDESIYFKKYFNNLKFELLKGIQEIYNQLYERYEAQKNKSYYKPIHLICVVEANQDFATNLKLELNKTFNTEVVLFSSPKECYYKLKSYKPDLIILDYDFDIFNQKEIIFDNGLTAAKAIKRDYPEQKFLLTVDEYTKKMMDDDIMFLSKEKKSMDNLSLIIKEMIPNLPINIYH